MKKILFTFLLSLISFQTWACSCGFIFYSFEDAWTNSIEEGLGLRPLVECVAIEETCGGMLYVVNNVVYEGSSMSDVMAGDTLKLWTGDGVDCTGNTVIPIGDTLML